MPITILQSLLLVFALVSCKARRIAINDLKNTPEVAFAENEIRGKSKILFLIGDEEETLPGRDLESFHSRVEKAGFTIKPLRSMREINAHLSRSHQDAIVLVSKNGFLRETGVNPEDLVEDGGLQLSESDTTAIIVGILAGTAVFAAGAAVLGKKSKGDIAAPTRQAPTKTQTPVAPARTLTPPPATPNRPSSAPPPPPKIPPREIGIPEGRGVVLENPRLQGDVVVARVVNPPVSTPDQVRPARAAGTPLIGAQSPKVQRLTSLDPQGKQRMDPNTPDIEWNPQPQHLVELRQRNDPALNAVATLIDRYKSNPGSFEKYGFYHGHEAMGALANTTPARRAFTYKGVEGNIVERFFQAEKLHRFYKPGGRNLSFKEAYDLLDGVAVSNLPAKARQLLGQADLSQWRRDNFVVMQALHAARFRENPELFLQIVSTREGSVFVENTAKASYDEDIWGNGRGKNHDGRNLLGVSYMTARQRFWYDFSNAHNMTRFNSKNPKHRKWMVDWLAKYEGATP